MDAQEYIRQHVNRMAAKKGPSVFRAQTIVIPPRKEKSADTLSSFLVFLILVIAFGTLGVMFFMSPKGKDVWAKLSNKPAVAVQAPVKPGEQPRPVSPDMMRREDALQFMSAVNQRMGKLEEEVKVWKHRVWLLGVANNENATLVEKMDTDFHKVTDRGFVKFDENWRLAPVPKNLQLSEDQKKELEGSK